MFGFKKAFSQQLPLRSKSKFVLTCEFSSIRQFSSACKTTSSQRIANPRLFSSSILETTRSSTRQRAYFTHLTKPQLQRNSQQQKQQQQRQQQFLSNEPLLSAESQHTFARRFSSYQHSSQYKSSVLPSAIFAASFIVATTTAAILIQNENKKRARTGRQPVSLFPAGFMADYPSHYPMLGSIFLINALVFAAWHFKGNWRLQRIIYTYFMHSTHSPPVSMLGSVFSHAEPIHLLFNMIAMTSFGSLVYQSIGGPHFLAAYLNAGVFASFVSLLHKSAFRLVTPSLGASGAVFGIVAMSVAINPFVQLSFIFLPFVTFYGYQLLPALSAIDFVGLVRKWKRFDHAAHLGGVVYGLICFAGLCGYYNYRPDWWRRLR